jgi:uncharacterized membrane protein YeaQ/YmgE (transglycosylase-associated protein family)
MKALLALLGLMFGSWMLWNLLGALIVGAIARMLLPGKDKVGWFTTILVGFLGGMVANVVAHLAGWVPAGKNTGILGSLLGAMGLLLLHRLWAMSRSGSATPAKPPSA